MVLGGLEGSTLVKGVLFDPYSAFFVPLEVLYGTRFSSKHYIMAQLVNSYMVGITDLFLDLWAPLETPKGLFMSNLSHFEAPNSHESGLLAPEKVIKWPKVTRFGPYGWSQQVQCVLNPKCRFFGNFYSSKRALFVQIMIF